MEFLTQESGDRFNIALGLPSAVLPTTSHLEIKPYQARCWKHQPGFTLLPMADSGRRKTSVLGLRLSNQVGEAPAAYFPPALISTICSVGGALENHELFVLHQQKITARAGLALVRNPSFSLGVTIFNNQDHISYDKPCRGATSEAKSRLWVQDHISHSNTENGTPHSLQYPFPI